MQYSCVTIDSIQAKENVIPLIFKELTGSIPTVSKQRLAFVGFEADKGTKFKINGLPNEVPSCGYFITPYTGQNDHMDIRSLSFDTTQSSLKIWFIY